MKNYLFSMLVLVFVGCSVQDKSIVGDWKTDSEFYKAQYQIRELNGQLIGYVNSYNDGTTKFILSKAKAFAIIKPSSFEVDAVAGATNLDSKLKKFAYQKISEDTIELINQANKHFPRERWIRIKTNTYEKE